VHGGAVSGCPATPRGVGRGSAAASWGSSSPHPRAAPSAAASLAPRRTSASAGARCVPAAFSGPCPSASPGARCSPVRPLASPGEVVPPRRRAVRHAADSWPAQRVLSARGASRPRWSAVHASAPSVSLGGANGSRGGCAAGPLSEGGHALQPARPPPPGHAQDGRARMASARGRPRDARRPSWSCAAEREHSLSSSRNTTGALRPGGASKACRGRSHRAGLGGIGKRSCGAEHTSSRLTLGSARAFATSRRSCYQCRMGARSCLLAEKPSAIRRQGARLQARMQDVRLPAAGPAFQALQRGLRRQARSGRPCAACSACSLGCTCGVRLRAPHSACCARGGAVHARPLAPVAACVMPDRCTWRDHTCPLTITRQPVQRGGCSSAARPARGACCGCRTAHSVQPAQAHACAHWLSGQHAALHRGPFPRERPAPGRLMAQPPQAPRRAARG